MERFSEMEVESEIESNLMADKDIAWWHENINYATTKSILQQGMQSLTKKNMKHSRIYRTSATKRANFFGTRERIREGRMHPGNKRFRWKNLSKEDF
jgi:hypothetical protein